MGLTEYELTLGTAAWLATKEPCVSNALALPVRQAPY